MTVDIKVSWVAVPIDLPNSPECVRLGLTLRRPHAWIWPELTHRLCAKHFRNGLIVGDARTSADVTLEKMIGWDGKRGRLVSAMLSAGLLERRNRNLFVPEFPELAGRMIRNAERDARRKAKERREKARERALEEAEKGKVERPRTVRGQSADRRRASGERPRTGVGPGAERRGEKEMEIEKERSLPPPPPTPSGAVVVEADPTGLLAELQRQRAENGLHQLGAVPTGWNEWVVKAYELAGPVDTLERIAVAHERYLRDPDFQRKRWPLPVFMSPNIWTSRLPAPLAEEGGKS